MISTNEAQKRLTYINSQPLELREKLKARINDLYFWEIAKVILKPE